MEFRLWTAVGLFLVITVGTVVGITVIALLLPGGSGGPPTAPDSGADAEAPSLEAPEPGLLTRVFRYAVAFGFGGVVGLFLGIVVGQKAARSQSTEPTTDRYDDVGEEYTEDADRSAEPEAATEGSREPVEGDNHAAFGEGDSDDLGTTADSQERPWESTR